MKCPKCGEKMMAWEYGYPSQEQYDGISEYKCNCGCRIGRWSGLELKENEIERRYGGQPVKIVQL